MQRHLLTLSLIFAFTLTCFAQGGHFTKLNPPGSIASGLSGIDNAGDMIGGYTDSGGISHAFLYSGGVYTTIGEAYYTELMSINNTGQILGYDNFLPGAFVYDIASGTETFFTCPHNLNTPFPFGINDSGVIVGEAQEKGADVGFELSGTVCSYFQVLGTSLTAPVAIGGQGDIVGWADSSSGQLINFMRLASGQIFHLNFAIGNPKISNLSPDELIILGNSTTTNSGGQVTKVVGFSSQPHKLTTIAYPAPGGGSVYETYAAGVNDNGVVVGYYRQTPASNGQAFIFTP